MTFTIAFPNIDPILIQIGPFAIRWYALAYIAGLLGGMYYMQALSRQKPVMIRENDIYDFLLWATLGVILGGRLGFVILYRPLYFSDHPLAIFQGWQGGMTADRARPEGSGRKRQLHWRTLGTMLPYVWPVGDPAPTFRNLVNCNGYVPRPRGCHWLCSRFRRFRRA